MPRTGWTPSIVPNGEDQTVYLVVDRFGPVCTENPIRVDNVTETPKLAE